MRDLIERDLSHVWHPCSQMKDFEHCPPFIVHKAKGSYLYTNEGKLIDAISSWWCKSLGHGHPDILAAIHDQLNHFEHVISANTTHKAIVEFAESLSQITNCQHVFFASDGSSAVEIALKLAIQANQLKGMPERNQFLALENAYHGETLATLSVSDVGIYKTPFEQFKLPCQFISNIPYVTGNDDPLWHDCQDQWDKILPKLDVYKDTTCAVILEPILQGAGGMLCYSADFLNRLFHWAQINQIYVIADEIMTGMGRTGQWLASHHAQSNADMICLSKGLTSGTVPFSCVSISHDIYQLFYDNYETRKAFMHSHTYSGNALGVRAALATLNYMQTHDINNKANTLGQCMKQYFTEIAAQTGKIHNVRSIGACVAGDLDAHDKTRLGFQFYQESLKRGAFLRPLGNTIYWFPPLLTDEATIAQLAEITLNSIKAL